MSAVCIELHFDGDARVLERDVVDERVVDVVDVVVLSLQQEGGRRLAGDVNLRVQFDPILEARRCQDK